MLPCKNPCFVQLCKIEWCHSLCLRGSISWLSNLPYTLLFNFWCWRERHFISSVQSAYWSKTRKSNNYSVWQHNTFGLRCSWLTSSPLIMGSNQYAIPVVSGDPQASFTRVCLAYLNRAFIPLFAWLWSWLPLLPLLTPTIKLLCLLSIMEVTRT